MKILQKFPKISLFKNVKKSKILGNKILDMKPKRFLDEIKFSINLLEFTVKRQSKGMKSVDTVLFYKRKKNSLTVPTFTSS